LLWGGAEGVKKPEREITEKKRNVSPWWFVYGVGEKKRKKALSAQEGKKRGYFFRPDRKKKVIFSKRKLFGPSCSPGKGETKKTRARSTKKSDVGDQ